ncbi:unnamed protein product [Aphanomyces euteiches]
MSLQDQVFAFVGKLTGMTRAEAVAHVEKAGASVTSRVTKRTTVLVAGGDGDAKAPVGVAVWNEDTFLSNLGLNDEQKLNEKVEEMEVADWKEEVDAKAVKKVTKMGKKRATKEDPEEAYSPKKVKKEPTPAPKTEPPAAGRITARKPDRHLATRDMFTIVGDYTTDLMQTNLGANNNKFYIIQLLQSSSTKTYHVFTRWGRLGEVGQQNLANCGNDLDKAIAQFQKKFKDKTTNDWGSRDAFVKHGGKYQLVELDTSETGDGDAGDAAMGKLSAAQINKGQAVLEQLKAAIASKKKGSTIADLSGEYYSFIPTLAGRQRPPPLNTIALVEEKEAMLDFWLRMGFDDMEEQTGLAPIEGIMDLPLPSTLMAAASNITNAGAIKECQNRGMQLVKSNAGSPTKPMDKELYGSIVLYTGNWIYSQLNSCLRSENRQSIRKYFNYLRVFLEAMCRMPQMEQTLWRGISVDLFDTYEEGKVITWWGVSSCTSDENVARNFMHSCGGSCTLLRVRCKTAMDISVLSMFPHEKECLLAPGTQLKVLKRVRNGKISEIEVEEVGRAI